jgi:hypothetical protein
MDSPSTVRNCAVIVSFDEGVGVMLIGPPCGVS